MGCVCVRACVHMCVHAPVLGLNMGWKSGLCKGSEHRDQIAITVAIDVTLSPGTLVN